MTFYTYEMSKIIIHDVHNDKEMSKRIIHNFHNEKEIKIGYLKLIFYHVNI